MDESVAPRSAVGDSLKNALQFSRPTEGYATPDYRVVWEMVYFKAGQIANLLFLLQNC